eukprot:CAMPEP_0182933510 /NCGR_PEP_ID=MMETSP0105_2-20130417/33989_1 /TAXON_ID=81532 ORGANISM="Acanthoeca-like sp., Strain 10tr" /NCGR_SAMPLE_ID=MMETSP0105_2 /ASSEMBLY_ACC=CAM_ASM_000205 /LENGTH=65 /DNA_ID=CAMNT_0025072251 /DNA_START=3 /DNA_END=197 /DNA_ORIENTATION=+
MATRLSELDAVEDVGELFQIFDEIEEERDEWKARCNFLLELDDDLRWLFPDVVDLRLDGVGVRAA